MLQFFSRSIAAVIFINKQITKEKKMLWMFLISLAIADDPIEEPKVVYKKKTEIDFEELEIDGELVKPQSALILERRKANFGSMITLRPNFDTEMNDSVKSVE